RIGMNLGDQPAVRGAYVLDGRALADAEQGARLRRTHRARRHHVSPPPHIGDHREPGEKDELDHQSAIAAGRAAALSPPGSGKAKPAIISRNSCRAARSEE